MGTLGLSFGGGQRLSAASLQAMVNQIDSLTGSGWVDYTTAAPSGGSAFALTASTANPTQGNSVYLARYKRPSTSDLCQVSIRLSIGSTFVVGTGNYRFGLPFTATGSSAGGTVGSIWINDSGTALRAGWVTLDSVTTYATGWVCTTAPNTVTQLAATSPQTWASGDVIQLEFVYEPA